MDREPRRTCEGCGKRTTRLQVAHIFGRHSVVGEPWASSRYLTMKLCFADPFGDPLGCHEKIDHHAVPELRERLEEIAARRLYEAFETPYPETLNAAGAVRRLAEQRLDPIEVDRVLSVA